MSAAGGRNTGAGGARTKCLLAGLMMLALTHGQSAAANGNGSGSGGGSGSASFSSQVAAHLIWKSVDTFNLFIKSDASLRAYAFDAVRSTIGNSAFAANNPLLPLFATQFTAPLVAAVRYPITWTVDGHAAASALVSLYSVLLASNDVASAAAAAERLLSVLIPLFITVLSDRDSALPVVMSLAQAAGQRFRDRVATLPSELQTLFTSAVVKAQSTPAAKN